jgi:short-subunit dehydrogenase
VKFALITGATGGLGKALSKSLSQKGYKLILSAREENLLRELSKEHNAEWVVCDLAKDLSPIFSVLEEKKPDLLINNAGFGFYGPFETLPRQEEMLDVNIKAPVSIAMKYVSVLKEAKKRGILLNISSAAGYFAFPYFATYSASKTFLRYFSEAINFELKGSGICVLVSMLGQVDTPFRERASLGAFSKKNQSVIDVEKAAAVIVKQIEEKKGLLIIDWRYKISVLFSRLLPKSWLNQILSRSILKRIRSIYPH